jgi:hypothetical protein
VFLLNDSCRKLRGLQCGFGQLNSRGNLRRQTLGVLPHNGLVLNARSFPG